MNVAVVRPVVLTPVPPAASAGLTGRCDDGEQVALVVDVDAERHHAASAQVAMLQRLAVVTQ